jgi:putative ABC transport system ATP-binding protein
MNNVDIADRRPLIRTENLRKVYTTDEVETTALNNVTLDIKTGEFIAIMGPSGCGKSTLLNILGLLDQPSGGTFIFDGTDVSDYNERRRADLRRGTLGFVFQSFNLIDELTVYENVELPLLYLSLSSSERRERTEAALDRVGMAHRRDHFPQQLSGGQQQRVAIARAVVASPQLILADEPTGNLDSTNGDEVMKLLSELNDAGATIVMVTHSPADAEFAHRIVNLFDGQVVSEHFMEKEYLVEGHLEPAAKGPTPNQA